MYLDVIDQRLKEDINYFSVLIVVIFSVIVEARNFLTRLVCNFQENRCAMYV